MKNKLLLHIGSHKTGSTYIQKSLNNVENKLNDIDFTYFCTTPLGIRTKESNCNSWFNIEFMGNNIKFDIEETFYKSIINTKQQNMIISAEELFWLNDSTSISKFVKKLYEIFSDIKIICYLRDPKYQFDSHLSQSFRSPDSYARKFFFNNKVMQHISYSQISNSITYLDYNKKLNLWSHAVGKNNIIAKEYNSSSFHENNIFCDFIKTLNLPKNLYSETISNSINCSLSVNEMIINSLIFEIHNEKWLGYKSLPFINYEETVTNEKTEKKSTHHNIISDLLKKDIIALSENYKIGNDWLNDETPLPPINLKNYKLILFNENDYKTAIKSQINTFNNINIVDFIKFKLKSSLLYIKTTKKIKFFMIISYKKYLNVKI
jgi:hypothetical protein